MKDKVQYSIVNTEDGNIAVQSTVKSFNLDHVTSKDIKTFYSNFSQYSAWDTGLLPVNGSGILSIRTAGEYTQFAYQHAPGLHHINWSAREGDKYASAYYLAQPYRIIICDMKEGQLLGARTFYSPYPITSPSQPLYHVNLPNINCEGYRGNGVGWICLYQNEDWSDLPLNERIVRFIERCSGVETYNDANMSETDGTRFYKKNNKPEYTWNPLEWQTKSEEGFEWTLDPDLWIPVLVESMDSQSAHKYDGQPLTFADAIVGDYKAYYYDDKHTKPINSVIRPDKELSSEEVLSYIVRSYNYASANVPLLNDTFNKTINLKSQNSSSVFLSSPLNNTVESHSNNDNDENTFFCVACESDSVDFGVTDHESGEAICENCSENYIFIQNANGHFWLESDEIVYNEFDSIYYHTAYDTVVICSSCDYIHATNSNDEKIKQSIINKVVSLDNGDKVCSECVVHYAEAENLLDQVEDCYGGCQTKVITNSKFINSYPTVTVVVPYYDYEQNKMLSNISDKTFCISCSFKYIVCPCGLVKNKDNDDFNSCTKTTLLTDEGSIISIEKACSSCVQSPATLNQNGELVAYYQPFNENIQKTYINSNILSNPLINQGIKFDKYVEELF
jgi:hypothetical protein